uniref:OSJNBa0080E14.4 protein n=1 Tax=Oryza sativa subsp. japonica TaxID=39947 RepID=Q7X7V9_ORYSJ|nr:OSJNBa0080E14.4 [Oryza sativa Japonica Group]CAE03085.1 OSJNBa0089E12.23 [Oryza sativa Japonica Group]
MSPCDNEKLEKGIVRGLVLAACAPWSGASRRLLLVRKDGDEATTAVEEKNVAVLCALTGLRGGVLSQFTKNRVNQSREHSEWSLRKVEALQRTSNVSAGVPSKHNHMEEQERVAPYGGDGFQVHEECLHKPTLGITGGREVGKKVVISLVARSPPLAMPSCASVVGLAMTLAI